MIKIDTQSFEETVALGEKVGSILGPGDVLCLSGDLGTGKTAFVNGVARSLGITSYITSPTFTIVNEYQGKFPLYHFDVYRISGSDEMFDIGFEEYINSEGITVIEWGEIIGDILPPELIKVNIRKNLKKGLDVREIEVCFEGLKYSGLEEGLAKASGGFVPGMDA